MGPSCLNITQETNVEGSGQHHGNASVNLSTRAFAFFFDHFRPKAKAEDLLRTSSASQSVLLLSATID
jgi:hypothetical protein